QEQITLGVAVRDDVFELEAELAGEPCDDVELRGIVRMHLRRLREEHPVTLTDQRRTHVGHAEMIGERTRDRVEGAGQQNHDVASAKVLLQPRDRGLVEPLQQFLGDELARERFDLVDREAAQVRLVLARRVYAADGQITQHEQQEREDLPRSLLAAQEQVAPEQPLGAAPDQRAVDVEDRELHRFCPIGPRISSFCDTTNSMTTGSPRTMQINTARYTKK